MVRKNREINKSDINNISTLEDEHKKFMRLMECGISGREKEYQEILNSMSPEEASRAHEKLAHFFFEEKNWGAAISTYEKFLRKEIPQTPYPYYELAYSYTMIRDFENAKKTIRDGKIEYPNFDKYDYLLANIMTSTGEMYEATQIFAKLLINDPTDQDLIRSYFGSLAYYEYYIMENFDKAKSHLQELFEKIDDEELKAVYKKMLKIFELDRDLKEAIKNASSFAGLKARLASLQKTSATITKNFGNMPPPNDQYTYAIQSLISGMEGKNFDKLRLINEKKKLEQNGLFSEAKLLDSFLRFSDYIKDLKVKYPLSIPQLEEEKALLILKTKTDAGLITLANQPREKETKKAVQQTEPYEIFLSDPGGIGTQEIKATEKEHKKYKDTRNKYDIFIYHRDVYTKKNPNPLKLENISYGILVLLLRYKDTPLPPIPFARKLRVTVDDSSPESEKDAHKAVKPFITPLRKSFAHIKGFNIEKIRHQPIKCNGKFSFCVILSKEEAKNYYLNEGAFAETEPGFE